MKWEIDIFNIKTIFILFNKYNKLQMLYKWTVARSIDFTINDSIHAIIQHLGFLWRLLSNTITFYSTSKVNWNENTI